MRSKMKVCTACDGEYVEGLYRAHTALGHEGNRRKRKRLYRCAYCKASYPRNEREAHLVSEAHLAHRREALPYAAAADEAYESGVDIDDICEQLGINPPQVYAAIRAFNIPHRGAPTPAQRHIDVRNDLVPKYGRRWSVVMKLRAQGKSWSAIQQDLLG